MRQIQTILIVALLVFTVACSRNSSSMNNNEAKNLPDISGYPIVETGQAVCYNDQTEIAAPAAGSDYYGQDAQFQGNTPHYVNNEDGTITDMVTGLMWSHSPDLNGDGKINVSDKRTYNEALSGAGSFKLAGYDDWRLPTIKELYSLIMFYGVDPSGFTGSDAGEMTPFINTDYFDFAYGDTDAGERLIDAQFASSTMYVDGELLFGVNFADGRIKGYGLQMPFGGMEKTFFVFYVRGNTEYGHNQLVDNGDGTISDLATGLMWTKEDSHTGISWKNALKYADTLTVAGHTDWRLPDAKELQSIVDYSRSPGTTASAAIDPLFNCTSIENEAGQPDYPYYWTGTTHANWTADHEGANAVYVSFGRAMGYMDGRWMDVHGAGAQRSDPKSGDPSTYPTGHGPQGDAIHIYNFVRCVRSIQ